MYKYFKKLVPKRSAQTRSFPRFQRWSSENKRGGGKQWTLHEWRTSLEGWTIEEVFILFYYLLVWVAHASDHVLLLE